MAESVKPLTNFDSALTCSEYKESFTWPKTINSIAQTIKLNLTDGQKSSMQIKSKPDTKIKTECFDDNVKLSKLKTEYRKKFQPFSNYIYITGLGWQKHKDMDKLNQKSGKKMEWYNEVEDRNRKANEFRNRSQLGHPVTSIDRLETIYKLSSGPLWNQIKDKSIASLTLATSQLRFQDSLKSQKSIKSKNRTILPTQEKHSIKKNFERNSLYDKNNKCQCLKLENNKNCFITSKPEELWAQAGSSKIESQPLIDSSFQTKSHLTDDICLDTFLNGPVKKTKIKSPTNRLKLKTWSPSKWTLEMDNKKELNWKQHKKLDNGNSSQQNAVQQGLFVDYFLKKGNLLVIHFWLTIFIQILALILVYKAIILAITLN